MKTFIEIESWEATKERLLETARHMDQGKQMTPVQRITFETAADLLAYLTPKRRQLLTAVREQPATVAAVAARLNRRQSSVRRDVKAMREVGLLKLRGTKDLESNKRVLTAARKVELRAML